MLVECAPRLGLRYRGFSNVRGQVLKRIARRIRELELPDVQAYRARLEREPAEWLVLERLCVVTLSRFYRDRAVWQALEHEVLPELARAAQAEAARAEPARAGEAAQLRCWSAGCASGEEPYTLSIVWELALAEQHPGLTLRVLATDRHEPVLERAARACYAPGTLRELPAAWRARAFEAVDGAFCLRPPFRRAVELRQAELGSWLPGESFRLLSCRNVVFTYFEQQRQHAVLEGLLTRLARGGALLAAPRERVPAHEQLEPWRPELGIYRKRST